MKTRTTVALFFVIVALICFGAWQAYAWVTASITEASTTTLAPGTTVAPTTTEPPAATTTTALSLAEAGRIAGIYCAAFYDSFYEYADRVASTEPAVGERQQLEAECNEELPGLVYLDPQLAGRLDTYCEGWDIGQEIAPDYFGPGVPATCPPGGGPLPVEK